MIAVEVNYLAVLAAAVASMAVGFVWYGVLFRKPWMEMTGLTMDSIKGMKMSPNTAYAIQFVASLVMAYVLWHGLSFGNYALEMSGLTGNLMGAFWYWLGFIAPITLGVVLWENKPWKLWFINASNYLVTLLVMAAIFSFWM